MSYPRFAHLVLLALVLILSLPIGVIAQNFSSGSTGVDGKLDYTGTPPGTVIFDPNAFVPPLDQDHDNIYNFTTITIPAGVTVKFTAQKVNGPVTWLATGNVTIDGVLDLSGAPGLNSNAQENRNPAVPGPGGFYGGIGGNQVLPPGAGQGPTPGAAGTAASNNGGNGGAFAGNSFLVPLIGGSGGGGGFSPTGNPTVGAGGGAGGGAILIASSTSIIISGQIFARGGQGGSNPGGGSGSGGAIRLAANTISSRNPGEGSLQVPGGGNAPFGMIRLEAFQRLFTGSIVGPFTLASPYATFVTSNPASIKVVSVAGVAVNPLPTGSFTVPDVSINNAVPVPVVLQGANIPGGTPVQLQFYSENGPDITATATLDANLAATAQVTFPTGYSRGLVSVTFTAPQLAPVKK